MFQSKIRLATWKRPGFEKEGLEKSRLKNNVPVCAEMVTLAGKMPGFEKEGLENVGSKNAPSTWKNARHKKMVLKCL